MNNFSIHPDYHARESVPHFDDTGLRDEWQKEVYEFARKIFDREGLKTVCDVGCGSGYKLLKYFPEALTIGVEVEPTLYWLREQYPERLWASGILQWPYDCLAVCADVLEHIQNPNEIMDSIQKLQPAQVVLSTPIQLEGSSGPPDNPYHIREWSMPEFREYVSGWFEIEQHFIANDLQRTQCILCHPMSR